MTKLKLKKGDRVWVRISVNATIKRVNQQFGYTIELDEQGKGVEMRYFGKKEVEKLSKK